MFARAGGLHDGGAFCGGPGQGEGRHVVFDVAQRDYLPGGEIRIAGPDGYFLVVGQLESGRATTLE